MSLIFDPVYNINIPVPCYLTKIINTIEFKRLKNIKQLGNTHYLYPSATHTRFEHSIGVSYLAGELLSTLQKKQPELQITNRDKELVQVAGLCHDIGHACFSHLFDSFLKKNNIIKNSDDSDCEENQEIEDSNEKLVDHENRSLRIISDMNLKYSLGYNQDEITFIKDLIKGKRSPYIRKSNFYYEIIANNISGLDCDKIDYLLRDSRNALGVINPINYDLLIKTARVIEDTICYEDSCGYILYQLFSLRSSMHKRVYQHEKVISYDCIITDILELIDKEEDILNNISNLDYFYKFTDDIIDKFLYKTENKDIKLLYNRLYKDDLYKCMKKFIFKDKKEAKRKESKINEIIKRNNSNNIFKVNFSKINFGYNNKNPVNKIYFYSEQDLNSKFKKKKDDISFTLPNIFEEYIIRIFCKNPSYYSTNLDFFDV